MVPLTRACARCGYVYEGEEIEVAFRDSGVCRTRTTKYRRGVCVVCLQTDGDESKALNRFLVKARSTIARHARKYGMTPADFMAKYNWSVGQLAHDMEFQWGNGCSYCHGRYQKMEHGLQAMTVDIMDRQAPPYYGTNTKLCCGTCNKAKGKMPLRQWGIRLAIFKRVLRWRAEHSRPKQLELSLL